MKKIAILFLIFHFFACSFEVKNYQTDTIKIIKVSNHVWKHTSFLQTETFGNVPCNGAIVVNEGKAIVFDTPTNDQASKQLIKWVQSELKAEIIAVVPTHFHEDCLGGLNEFHNINIESYALDLTMELTKSQNIKTLPQNKFSLSKEFLLVNKKVIVSFFGEGHTKDNVVAYFPEEKVLFGGCLLKSLGASKGYLGDANVKEWPNTIQKIKNTYPEIEIVIPGHGKHGDSELLEYTQQLFQESSP